MQTLIRLLLLTLALPLSASNEITVYTYDSFTSKGSLGAFLQKSAQEKLGIKTKFVPFPSAGEALNQVAIEGKGTRADLIVGIDRAWLGRAREMKVFGELDPKLAAAVPVELLSAGPLDFLPFDLGYLAFLYDSRRTKAPKAGISFAEFSKLPELKKKVVIEDPRTSSIGLSFLLWTRFSFADGAQWESYWKDFAKQISTISPGWSGAYGMFLKKQADWVLSYTTSPAYHIEEEKLDAIKAVIFPEGHYRQVEGAMLVKSSKNAALASKWLEHLLSPEVQEAIPKTQWMYPVRKGVKLPKSFEALPVPKGIEFPSGAVEGQRKDWLKVWTALMARQS